MINFEPQTMSPSFSTLDSNYFINLLDLIVFLVGIKIYLNQFIYFSFATLELSNTRK